MATEPEAAYVPTDEELDTQVEPIAGMEEPAADETPTPEPQAPDYEGWAAQNGYVKPQPAIPDAQEDPRFAQLEELQYSDPKAAEALRVQIAEDRAIARMRQEFGPLIAPNVQKNALETLGLTGEGAKYVGDLLSKEDPRTIPAILANPAMRELLQRAGNDFEREKAPVRAPRHESAHSENGPLNREEQQAANDFERQFGVKADKETIALARRDAAKRMN